MGIYMLSNTCEWCDRTGWCYFCDGAMHLYGLRYLASITSLGKRLFKDLLFGIQIIKFWRFRFSTVGNSQGLSEWYWEIGNSKCDRYPGIPRNRDPGFETLVLITNGGYTGWTNWRYRSVGSHWMLNLRVTNTLYRSISTPWSNMLGVPFRSWILICRCRQRKATY